MHSPESILPRHVELASGACSRASESTSKTKEPLSSATGRLLEQLWPYEIRWSSGVEKREQRTRCALPTADRRCAGVASIVSAVIVPQRTFGRRRCFPCGAIFARAGATWRPRASPVCGAPVLRLRAPAAFQN